MRLFADSIKLLLSHLCDCFQTVLSYYCRISKCNISSSSRSTIYNYHSVSRGIIHTSETANKTQLRLGRTLAQIDPRLRGCSAHIFAISRRIGQFLQDYVVKTFQHWHSSCSILKRRQTIHSLSITCTLDAGLLARKSVFGRSCHRPPGHRFFLVSLCL
jgi:hypothetical protein